LVIADTNVWIHYIRHESGEIGQELDDLLEDRKVALVGVVLAEILQGATGEQDHQRLAHALEMIDYIEDSRDAWANAGRLVRTMRERGEQMPLTDLLIASITIAGDHELFTLDRAFSKIPGLRLYKEAPDA
jgi:predicted nucleic acid-binding protein